MTYLRGALGALVIASAFMVVIAGCSEAPGAGVDAGGSVDASGGRDTGSTEGGVPDAGPGTDAAPTADAGFGSDSGIDTDAGVGTDAGIGTDAGPSGMDAGAGTDAGSSSDAGTDARPTMSCAGAGDCDDGNRCNGAETCAGGTCAPGTPPDCADTNACTTDSCLAAGATMCRHVIIDADTDGYSPTSLGACGTDCDDGAMAVHPGAPDTCVLGDGRDDDCDGIADDEGLATYYADCDGDGYAPATSTGIDSCVAPAISMTGCGSGATRAAWTMRAPIGAANIDCNDGNATANPGQMTYQTMAIAGAPMSIDFDYDCDAAEEPRYTGVAACAGGFGGCMGNEGWQTAEPACGVRGTWLGPCVRDPFGFACSQTMATRTQECL